jgi:hypothetical protein
MVDKRALGQVFSEYFGFPLSISFYQRSILIFIYVAATRRTTGTFQKAMFFRKSGSIGYKNTFIVFL